MSSTQDNSINWIRKRDERITLFHEEKISSAIFSALEYSEKNTKSVQELTNQVIKKLTNDKFVSKIPKVENIQDLVQIVLIENNYSDVAKNYISYRLERRRFRESIMLKNPIFTFIHKIILKYEYSLFKETKFHTRNIPLRKEHRELENMGYLIIEVDPVSGLKISPNPKKLNEITVLTKETLTS